MRNTSIFLGVKELRELTFISNGAVWDVYKDAGNARIFAGKILKVKRESNVALYRRGLEMLEED